MCLERMYWLKHSLWHLVLHLRSYSGSLVDEITSFCLFAICVCCVREKSSNSQNPLIEMDSAVTFTILNKSLVVRYLEVVSESFKCASIFNEKEV